ncbi:MAG: Dam family site-specific DNA-(adenine-N6)-methyltransferase [Acetobacter sp.]|nr:Dam family site-specific DNA-(adenine-N6)-methyltransferase [Acetobacter sp.]
MLPYFPTQINAYIEPFVGGGSVFLNVNAQKFVLNDIDRNMIKLHNYLCTYSSCPDIFFQQIINRIRELGLSRSFMEDIVPSDLKTEYPKTYYAKFNKESYSRLRDEYNKHKENVLDLYLLLIYGFNRILRFNSKGDFNLPVGNVDFNKNVVNALKTYFRNVCSKTIHFFNCDYKEFINLLTYKENDFIYLDPPYLITFSEYNKLWNKDKERELLDLLDELTRNKVKWSISKQVADYNKNTHNEIYGNLMQQYNIHKINSYYISFNNNKVRPTSEVLVTNY